MVVGVALALASAAFVGWAADRGRKYLRFRAVLPLARKLPRRGGVLLGRQGNKLGRRHRVAYPVTRETAHRFTAEERAVLFGVIADAFPGVRYRNVFLKRSREPRRGPTGQPRWHKDRDNVGPTWVLTVPEFRGVLGTRSVELAVDQTSCTRNHCLRPLQFDATTTRHRALDASFDLGGLTMVVHTVTPPSSAVALRREERELRSLGWPLG